MNSESLHSASSHSVVITANAIVQLFILDLGSVDLLSHFTNVKCDS